MADTLSYQPDLTKLQDQLEVIHVLVYLKQLPFIYYVNPIIIIFLIPAVIDYMSIKYVGYVGYIILILISNCNFPTQYVWKDS